MQRIMGIFRRILKRRRSSGHFIFHKTRDGSKKDADSIKGRKKEVNSNYIRYGAIFIVWCILIVLAMQVDIEYHSKKGTLFSGAVDFFVDVGHAWGISHAFLYEAMGGYSSILLTVVGMIVTGWISLSERLDQIVYGIRRRELFANSFAGKCLAYSFIGVFCTPAWMAFVVIRKYCFTAYFIMGLIFMQFLVSNILLATTYSRNQDYIRLNKKLAYSIMTAVRAEEYDGFGRLLDRIECSIEENTDWNEMNALFLDCIKRAQIKEEHKLYRISSEFLTRVYAQRNQERMPDLAILCLQKISKGYRIGDDGKTKLMYWTVLDCLYQNCTEKQICLYVNRLLDLFSLNEAADYAWVDLPVVWLEEIFAMLALQTERWMQLSDSRQKNFEKTFGKMIELGKAVYLSKERSDMILNFIEVRQSVLKEIDGLMYRCFDRLRESYFPQERMLYIGSLLRYAAGLHQ